MSIAPWNNAVWQGLTEERSHSTHAWLFSGPEGLGKVELALNYARYLLGQPPNFDAASHPDFHVLTPEDRVDAEGDLVQRYGMRYVMTKKGLKPKSVISVDQVRELIRSLVTYAYGAHKVVLITPAHSMNINAANALLKILEEPPSDTIFVLVSSDPAALPATVRSRCSDIQFRIPPTPQALHWLAEYSSDEAEVKLALSVAGGAPMLAETMLKNGFLKDRGSVIHDIQIILAGTVDVTVIAAKWKELGAGPCLSLLRNVLIDLIRIGFQPDPPYLFNPDYAAWLQASVKRLHLKRVFSLTERIGSYLKDISAPLDKNLVIEDFLLELNGAKKHDG